MTKRGITLILLSVVAFCMLFWIYYDNLPDDEAWAFQQIAGIAVLTFIGIGSFVVLTIRSSSEIVFIWMVRQGDKLVEERRFTKARRWYERCLFLDDRILNNTAKRSYVLSMLSKTYGSMGKKKLAARTQCLAERAREEIAGNMQNLDSRGLPEEYLDRGEPTEGINVPGTASGITATTITRPKKSRPSATQVKQRSALKSTRIYRYPFVIMFGALALVFAIEGSYRSASIIFLVGTAINAYWIHAEKLDI